MATCLWIETRNCMGEKEGCEGSSPSDANAEDSSRNPEFIYALLFRFIIKKIGNDFRGC